MLCLFDEEDQYSPHDIAWLSKDWDAVQKLADEFKEKPENEFFEILNNINVDKKEMFVGNMESYSKFAIDNTLSKSIECLQAVYFANLFLHEMDDQSHYNYLIHAIPHGRRFPKSSKIENPIKDIFIIKLLMKYYSVNEYRAKEYRDMLEHKGHLNDVLKLTKGFVTDEFLKSITKNVKEQKELKKLL